VPLVTHSPEPARATDAVATFVQHHQLATWRFLHVLGCRGAEAESIVQDALVLALQKGVHERPDAEGAAFLRQTGKHLWLRSQRADRRRLARHAAAAERAFQQDLGDSDGSSWLAALVRCLEELPARSRRALDATYRDGLSRAELATELGLGEHGVRTLLQRLRAALRGCIERRREP